MRWGRGRKNVTTLRHPTLDTSCDRRMYQYPIKTRHRRRRSTRPRHMEYDAAILYKMLATGLSRILRTWFWNHFEDRGQRRSGDERCRKFATGSTDIYGRLSGEMHVLQQLQIRTSHACSYSCGISSNASHAFINACPDSSLYVVGANAFRKN